jgi:hypothetical protein
VVVDAERQRKQGRPLSGVNGEVCSKEFKRIQKGLKRMKKGLDRVSIVRDVRLKRRLIA